MFFKHISHKQVIKLFSFYGVSFILFDLLDHLYQTTDIGPIEKYGAIYSYVFYSIHTIALLITMPMNLYNIFGTLFYHEKRSKLKVLERNISSQFHGTIGFRIVTRGNFPDLVKNNIKKHMQLLNSFEMISSFIIEVVTDKSIGLSNHDKVYELVVPSDYKTKTGAKFKARALQYALEENVSKLKHNDWIVHLDEETLLTKSSIIGILDFVIKNNHPIGQGMITYGKDTIVHWLNTLADSMRVSVDLGALRFSLKTLHRPLFSFKGSFIVCKNCVEKLVSFDHGLEGSITEDAFFAVKSSNLGFTFDWIEGEMYEKSPFTFMDFLRQRKRWVYKLNFMEPKIL